MDHLEDLRGTIIKILATLSIGVGICFFIRNDLMEAMRAPIDGVWKLQLDASLHELPVKVNAQTWEKATKASREGLSLSPEQRAHFYRTLSGGEEGMEFHIHSVNLWRSALAFKERKERDVYIQSIPEITDQMKAQLLMMSKYYHMSKGAGPNPDAEFRKRTVFMQSLHPTEGFMLSFKLSLYAGIALTFPFLLFFLLQFILPGLHQKEKKALFPALFIGFSLFLSGVFFSYYIVLPRVLEFFTTFSGQMGITNDWRIGDYISFTTQFILIFGLAFELPVIVMTLVFLGVLERAVMVRSRSYAVVGILVIAAVITPTPDVMTLGLLAIPMYLLYELCIFLSWFIERKRKKEEQMELSAEKERLERLLKEVEKEEKSLHEELGVSAPAGLITHEEEDLYSAWNEHHAHEENLDGEHPIEEDLEGNGKALDPEAEEREAGGNYSDEP